ncbi:glycosyltransferase family 90 protein [Rhizoctonia solani]|uniref:Glycosyltransferase family 90 protein n=1 Tax=Rhizoctonia solani TaxID=456999 RepID=A0A8H8PBA5_9AGAM|nr:glycosyltransferase family 90 protein [Rhizoctonia solani]QRW27592.1 glycosyltransferase family 90 protein [Rhizoctonia solani]
MKQRRFIFRTVSHYRRFVLIAATVSTLSFLCLSPLFSTSTAWRVALQLLPPTPNSLGLRPSHKAAYDLPVHEIIEGGRHPIHGLITDAEAKRNNLVQRQSTTLSAAVKEYRRRYGRQPPAGFEQWYEFARSINFKLIDEFDQIDRDITPFLALPPHIIHNRIELASKDDHSYHLTIKDGNATIGGPLGHWDVAVEFEKLIRPFVKSLPDMKFYVSGHDGGPTILPEDMRLAVNRVLKQGKRLTQDEVTHLEDLKRNPRRGVANACLEDPVTFYPSALPERNPHTHTFISDHRLSMSFCANPTILNNPAKRHGYFAYDVPHQRSAFPLLVQSQPEPGGAILHPALQSYLSAEVYHSRFGPIVPWRNRSETVFWRGRTTGEWFSRAHDWRFSHRIRIHTLATPGGNLTDPNVTPEVEVLVEDEMDGNIHLKMYSRDTLNEKYMDVSLIGGPVQCDNSENDHTCQEMDSLKWGKETGWDGGLSNKYLLDIDGNGWSSRFQRLMTSGAVVFKMSIFPEWNSDWLIPYYHYVPVQTDYSDLYDALAFFIGTPDGLPGHDDLAEKIGAQAHRFTVEQWRPEDMQVYIYRLLLEYAQKTRKAYWKELEIGQRRAEERRVDTKQKNNKRKHDQTVSPLNEDVSQWLILLSRGPREPLRRVPRPISLRRRPQGILREFSTNLSDPSLFGSYAGLEAVAKFIAKTGIGRRPGGPPATAQSM